MSATMHRRIWERNWKRVRSLSQGGHGRTSIVVRNGDTDNTEYVLKELVRQDDPERRRRMAIEVNALKVLDHPGLARFVESNAEQHKEDVELYVITEKVE